MIINLQTMTDDELQITKNAVWQVYEESCWWVDGDYETKSKWGDLCREAWDELRELADEWKRRGNDLSNFLLVPPLEPEPERQQDPAAAAARDHLCAGCGCSLGPAWMQTDQTKQAFCLSCFDSLPIDDSWEFAEQLPGKTD